MMIFLALGRCPEKEAKKFDAPEQVYVMRTTDKVPAEKELANLMKAICRQIKTRYYGFEDMTPTKMTERLDIIVCRHRPDSSWPEFIGYVYYDTNRRCWTW